MNKINLLSFLKLINSESFDELKPFLNDNSHILEILELFDIVEIISSSNPLKLTLTSLGASILQNGDIITAIQQQDSKLNAISSDLQRIKSSLSAISLDVIRSQGIMQENPYGSDFLLNKENTFKEHSVPKNSSSKSDSISQKISNYSFEDLKGYVHEVYQGMESENLELQQRKVHQIKKSYAKIVNLLQQAEFKDFGLESFILIDAILIFLLLFFDQKDPQVLNSSLEKKYSLLSNLPLTVDADLLRFLDKVNTDILTNASDPLTIGEKTAKKIYGLLNDLYKPFIGIFEV